MIRQTRTINGLSLCSCLLKEQVQERLNSPDLQSNVVLRNLRCMATHVSGGVYIYINSTFTYYGSLKIEKLLKIFFWGQIGRNQEAKAGQCNIDPFCLAHLRGKFLART